MIPVHFQDFVNNLISILQKDQEYLALAAGGSWVDQQIDRFSDIDLVIVHRSQSLSVDQRIQLAESAGDLLSAFTGEHVGEPRLIICLYDNPLIHVDLKFVHLEDMTERVEDPLVLWECENILSDVMASSKSAFPHPDFQWIEDRFWVWIHYGAAKIGRGELFEVLTFISFLQQTVLGPLALLNNAHLPKGVRKLEMILPASDLEAMLKTNASYDQETCLHSLKNAVAFYRILRNSLMTNKIQYRTKAELRVMTYLEDIHLSLNQL
ncbi:aminoglycoside 6-adenylyltransferase [Dyadobacter sp. CY345]|uniref:aminoglycoside 6-adenylyltransferase n=1 Tax=Dyadobacter sp. CY345 TaxID=2909335 RepID=UPI001F224D1A|nr:aminoglycoside 6-adenylyltransferase [Dyadobacter sp. CY345]MCF2447273.1 aminoglycoside 6-adenylyltransferase [Dyadobacter sp. CY345]